MDFDLTERQAFFRDHVRSFIDEHIRPRVADYHAEVASGDRWAPLQVIEELKPLAREAGLWNLFMPPGGARLRHDHRRRDGVPPCRSSGGRFGDAEPQRSRLTRALRRGT